MATLSSFRINQPPGTPYADWDRARRDIVPNDPVEFEALEKSQTSYKWEFESLPKGFSVTINNSTTHTSNAELPGSGGCLIRLIVNEGLPNESITTLYVGVRMWGSQISLPALGETNQDNSEAPYDGARGSESKENDFRRTVDRNVFQPISPVLSDTDLTSDDAGYSLLLAGSNQDVKLPAPEAGLIFNFGTFNEAKIWSNIAGDSEIRGPWMAKYGGPPSWPILVLAPMAKVTIKAVDTGFGPATWVAISGDGRVHNDADDNEIWNYGFPYIEDLKTNSGTSSPGEVLTVSAGSQVYFADPVVSSVFGRTGVVVAADNDYAASQVDNDSGVGGDFVDDALDILNTAITAITSGYSRREAVINVVDCTAAPPTEVEGDRYILDFTVGTVHPDWDTADKGDIAERLSTAWQGSTPKEGWVAYVDAQNKDALYVDDGTPAWELRNVYTRSHADLTDVTEDQHHNRQHSLGSSSDHSTGTLAALNSLVSDGTLGSIADADPANVTKEAAVQGSSGNFARQDHKHDITTEVAGSATPGDSAAEGSTTSLARSDHQHGLPAFGTGSGDFCEGDDSRVTGAQQTSEKNAASGYPGLDGSSKLTGSQQVYGSAANTACEGNDSRLSDARTPTAHDVSSASYHNGVAGATAGNLALFDANGLFMDGGISASALAAALAKLSKFEETVFIPISDAIDGDTAPAVLETITSTNGKVEVRKFDPTTEEDVRIPWEVPPDIAAADGLEFEVCGIITEATAPASGEGVSFQLSGYSIGVGDALNGTFGTEVTSEDADLNASGCDTQYDRFKTTQSSAVTITGLAAGELAMLKFNRDPSDTDDDYAQDVGVYGITIKYNREIVAGS